MNQYIPIACWLNTRENSQTVPLSYDSLSLSRHSLYVSPRDHIFALQLYHPTRREHQTINATVLSHRCQCFKTTSVQQSDMSTISKGESEKRTVALAPYALSASLHSSTSTFSHVYHTIPALHLLFTTNFTFSIHSFS